MTCIICGQPRLDTRLDCGSPSCRAKVGEMPTEELNAIREREAIEAMKGEGKPYIHLTPRDNHASNPDPNP